MGKKGIWCNVKLVKNGLKPRINTVLWDTGSSWSLCSDTLRHYAIDIRPIPPEIILVSATGGKIKGTGVGIFAIQLDGIEVRTDVFLVDSSISWPYTILGLNLLDKINSLIDIKNKKIIIQPEGEKKGEVKFSFYASGAQKQIKNCCNLITPMNSDLQIQLTPTMEELEDILLFPELYGETDDQKLQGYLTRLPLSSALNAALETVNEADILHEAEVEYLMPVMRGPLLPSYGQPIATEVRGAAEEYSEASGELERLREAIVPDMAVEEVVGAEGAEMGEEVKEDEQAVEWCSVPGEAEEAVEWNSCLEEAVEAEEENERAVEAGEEITELAKEAKEAREVENTVKTLLSNVEAEIEAEAEKRAEAEVKAKEAKEAREVENTVESLLSTVEAETEVEAEKRAETEVEAENMTRAEVEAETRAEAEVEAEAEAEDKEEQEKDLEIEIIGANMKNVEEGKEKEDQDLPLDLSMAAVNNPVAKKNTKARKTLSDYWKVSKEVPEKEKERKKVASEVKRVIPVITIDVEEDIEMTDFLEPRKKAMEEEKKKQKLVDRAKQVLEEKKQNGKRNPRKEKTKSGQEGQDHTFPINYSVRPEVQTARPEAQVTRSEIQSDRYKNKQKADSTKEFESKRKARQNGDKTRPEDQSSRPEVTQTARPEVQKTRSDVGRKDGEMPSTSGAISSRNHDNREAPTTTSGARETPTSTNAASTDATSTNANAGRRSVHERLDSLYLAHQNEKRVEREDARRRKSQVINLTSSNAATTKRRRFSSDEEEDEEEEPQRKSEFTPCHFIGDIDGGIRNKEIETEEMEWEPIGEEDIEIINNILDTNKYFAEDQDIDIWDTNPKNMKLNECPAELQPIVKNEMEEFRGILAKNNFDVGSIPPDFANLFFEVFENKRAFTPDYIRSAPEVELMERIEKIMIKIGVLTTGERSRSFRARTFLVKKPGYTDYTNLKSYRLITDFRNLNNIIKPISSNIPFVDSIREQMKNFEYISKIDICQGFFSLHVHPECTQYLQTSRANSSGTCFYLRAPQGLKSSPECFQTAMQKIVDTIPDKIGNRDVKSLIFIYIDDFHIINREGGAIAHWKILKILFKKLAEYGIKLRMTKLELFKKEAMILGLMCDASFLSVNKDKTAVLQAWVEPLETRKQIQSFLGLTGYYRMFVKDYALKSKCLYELLKNEVPEKNIHLTHWKEEHSKAFNEIRDSIINACQLALPDYKKDFIVTVDASIEGAGYVLSQIMTHKLPSGKEKEIETPLIFGSRAFRGIEKTYSASERELLALYFAILKFNYYLRYSKVIIRVDCQALISLRLGFENKFMRQYRMIQAIDSCLDKGRCEIIHKKGTSPAMNVADALSRHSPHTWERIKSEIMPKEDFGEPAICHKIHEGISPKEGGGKIPQNGEKNGTKNTQNKNIHAKNGSKTEKHKNSNGKAGKRRETREYPNKSVAPSPASGTTREEHACPRRRERRERDSEGEEERQQMAYRIAPVAPQPRSTPMDAPTGSSTAAATSSTSNTSSTEAAETEYSSAPSTPRTPPGASPAAPSAASSAAPPAALMQPPPFVPLSRRQKNNIYKMLKADREELLATQQPEQSKIIVAREYAKQVPVTHDSQKILKNQVSNIEIKNVKEIQKDDPNVRYMYNYVRSNTFPDIKTIHNNELRGLLKNKNKFIVKNGILMRKINDIEAIVLPNSYIENLYIYFHQNGGHHNAEKTYQNIIQKYYSYKLLRELHLYVSRCPVCSLYAKKGTGNIQATHISASRANDKVFLDLIGKLPESEEGYIYCLNGIDCWSRYGFSIGLRNIDGQSIVSAYMKGWVWKYGHSKEIVIDNGMVSQNLTEYCKINGVKLTRIAVYTPNSNLVERLNGSMKKILFKTMYDMSNQWNSEILAMTMFLYNISQHRSVGYSPHYLFLGQQPNLPLDLLLNSSEVREDTQISYVTNLRKAIARVTGNAYEAFSRSVNMSSRRNNLRNSDYSAGDYVLVKNFRKKNKTEPNFLAGFEIVRRIAAGTYLVKNVNTQKYSKVAIRDIKKDFAHFGNIDTNEENGEEREKENGEEREKENDEENERNQAELEETPNGVDGQTDQNPLEDAKAGHEVNWDELGGQGVRTRVGREVKPPKRYGQEEE